VPNVLANYEAYHGQGFEVVGVNMDTDLKLAQQYIQETGANFPTIFSDDPEANGWNSPLAVKYGVTGIPRVILVDKDGKVVSTMARGPRLGQLLEKLLGPPAEATGDNKSSSIRASRSNSG
jgi:peroxiredoxin